MQLNRVFRESPLQLGQGALDTAVAGYAAVRGEITDSFVDGHARAVGTLAAFAVHGGSACWHAVQALESHDAYQVSKGKDLAARADSGCHLLLGAGDLMAGVGLLSALSGHGAVGTALVVAGTTTKLLTRHHFLAA